MSLTACCLLLLALCFVTLHPTDISKMQVVILCRTQGLNLGDFMFREDSNVAIHILDNIAYECGRLLYKELRHAGQCLLRDSLWKSLVSKTILPKKSLSLQASPKAEPSVKARYHDLAPLIKIHPLLQLAASKLTGKAAHAMPLELDFLFSIESGIDWKSVCVNMRRCLTFSSCSSFLEDEEYVRHLLYMQDHDVFLSLLIGSKDPRLFSIDVMEKDYNPTKHSIIFDTVVNCLLHYVWQNL